MRERGACTNSLSLIQTRPPLLNHFQKDLAAAARSDKEEWVATMGAAVGTFTGCLDLDAAAAASAPLRGTLAALEAAAVAGALPGPADDFRPLEEAYLTRRLQEAARGGGTIPATLPQPHFRVRAEGVPAPAGMAAAAAAAAAAAGGGGIHGLGVPALSPPPTAAPLAGAGGGGLLSPPPLATAAGGLAAASRRAAGLGSTANLAGAGGGHPGRPPPAAAPTAARPAAAAVDAPGAASMFRSSRPTVGAGPGGRAGGGAADTGTGAVPRGAAREVRAKVLDVADAIVARRAAAPPQQQQAEVVAVVAPPAPPSAQPAGPGGGSDREEGEVEDEDGELPGAEEEQGGGGNGGGRSPKRPRAPRWMDYDAPVAHGGGALDY